MQAVILAGGKGTRLASRLNGRPKPLVMVDGVPLLQRQIEQLRDQGFDQVLVLVNHEAQQIIDFLNDANGFGVDVKVVDDGKPRGTAGAVLACRELLQPEFLVVYGDTLFDIDMAPFIALHRERQADATLFVHPNDHPADSDLIEMDEDGLVKAFHGYPHPPASFFGNQVNAALYVIRRDALAAYTSEPGVILDFAKDLFPRMLEDGHKLVAYSSFEYIKDLGTPDRLDRVEAALRSGAVRASRLTEPQKAVFVDRDGTINQLRGFLSDIDQLELLPGAAEAIRRLNKAGYRAVLITNQPVIARGELSFDGLSAIHRKLETLLGDGGGFLDRIYFCPHHPHAGYPGEVAELKIVCDCRKPEPGLIHRAAKDLNIDLAKSWFVGDSTADIAAGHAAGLRTILVETGEGGRDGKNAVSPDVTQADLAAAVAYILDENPQA